MRRSAARPPSFLAFAFVVVLGARPAEAYPQWQLSTDIQRCDQCHYAPEGGGLINNFGRDFVGEESTFGGNGDFLHGAATLPSWLALGADVRGAFASEDVGDVNGASAAVFPMQADAMARVSYHLVSFSGTVGFRGQVRSDDSLVPLQNYQPITDSRLISREHYVLVRAGALGGYLRAGRFFAPFGLRLAEHIVYVRRDLGFATMEEELQPLERLRRGELGGARDRLRSRLRAPDGEPRGRAHGLLRAALRGHGPGGGASAASPSARA